MSKFKTILILGLAMVLISIPAMAGKPYANFWFQVQDEFAAARTDFVSISVYTIDTTTPATIYASEQGGTKTNPILLAATSNGTAVWYGNASTYDIIVTFSDQVVSFEDFSVYDHRVMVLDKSLMRILTLAGVTDSSSSVTGTLIVSGGVGIAKKLYVGTDLDVAGASTLTTLALDGVSTHAIDIQPSATMGDYKAIYIGTWGTEAEFNDGGGLFRIYGKVGAGGGASANIFVRTLTDSTSGVVSAQFYTDVDSGTPGPTGVGAVDCFAILNAGKYLATSVASTDGMHALWAKVSADVTSVANGNVCAIWADNQMNCAVAGSEYGIWATTGGSVPNGFIGFTTTSAGYAQFIYADATFNSGAGTCIETDDITGETTQDARIKVWYDGTQYYIPLYR